MTDAQYFGHILIFLVGLCLIVAAVVADAREA